MADFIEAQPHTLRIGDEELAQSILAVYERYQAGATYASLIVFRRTTVPEKETLDRARRDAKAGKAPSTQAGEFVREEFEHIREGKHGARSTKQAIAIGLSKARRAGVKLPAPKAGGTSARTRQRAARDAQHGRSSKPAPSRKRSAATLRALKKETGSAASHRALARQAKGAARKRSPAARSQQAKRAARTRRASRGSAGGSK